MSRYQRTAVAVEAVRLSKAVTLGQDPSFGRVSGSVGDWLITEQNGVQYIVSDSQFKDWFTPNDADRLEATVVTVEEGTPTAVRRPTWRWTQVADAASYRYQLDGGQWVSVQTTYDRVFTPQVDLAIGTHTLLVEAVDAWGLPGITASAEVEITA